jgi:hypothetical protein
VDSKPLKKAVCVGINDYPGDGNDLRGCVNDANDWASLLKEVYGFEDVTLLLDADASREAMMGALRDLVEGGSNGDILVYTYSGHGTWVYDGADADESDNRDEALCAHDDIIVDDEIREVLAGNTSGAHLTVISDSCHSGTVTRLQRARLDHRDENNDSPEDAPRLRFMPPENGEDAVRAMTLPVRRRVFYPEAGMNETLMTGCNALEYSFDAYINGRFNGAMTALAIALIRDEPHISYAAFHRKLRKLLPTNQWPQSPQLEGNDDNKNRPLFT